jgi:uroporphyrin-III C-methyltransferase
LTIEALRLLKTADVVFHDDLVSPEILALIPASTHVESVGKRCGKTAITQQQIHALLINAAREGWNVVRLKSGDPLIFGRAGEEMDALREAGIKCEVVPGITAALGAAARAGIPLTDRRLASKVILLSNHHCSSMNPSNWESVISQDSTVLIYMPGTDYESLAGELSSAGLDPETPCVLISQATTPRQQVHCTTLANLCDAHRLPAPIVLILGAVAGAYLSRMRNFTGANYSSTYQESPVEISAD